MANRIRGYFGKGKNDDDEQPVDWEQPDKDTIHERLHSPGRWLMVGKELFRILKQDQVLMLAVLIEAGRIARHCAKPNKWDGWFFYKIRQGERDLGFIRTKQARIIRFLKSKKIIRVKRRGPQALRYFKIDHERIEKLLERADRA